MIKKNLSCLHILLGLILMSCLRLTQAQMLMSPLNQLNTPAHPALSKQVWLVEFAPKMSAELCKLTNPPRNCLQLEDDVQCQNFANTITQACLNSLEKILPDSLTYFDQENYSKVGYGCGTRLFYKLAPVNPSAECQQTINGSAS